jgi:hypothetical protein
MSKNMQTNHRLPCMTRLPLVRLDSVHFSNGHAANFGRVSWFSTVEGCAIWRQVLASEHLEPEPRS